MRVTWVVFALVPVLLLAACGSDDDEPQPARSKASAGFPVTIEHARGKTVIPAAPKRVVTIGYTDHEILLALGIKPVGAMDWFGERPYGKWPWEKPRWGGDAPEIIGGGGKGYNVEKIASLRPDLIIGLYAGADDLNKATYDKLSQIAPTVGPSPTDDDYTTPWQDMTRVAGRAVGKEERANELIGGIERRFADVRQRHPEFADQTAVVVDAGTAPKEYWAFASDDPRGQFMRELGFKPSPAIDKAAGDNFGFELSPERLELLDVDRLVLLVDPKPAARLKADRLFRSLKVAREGRVTYLRYYTDPPVGAALAFNSVLSIPYGVDRVLPLLGD